MRIIIDESAYIEIDKFNHMLYVTTEDKKSTFLKKPPRITKPIGFYQSIQAALTALLKYRINTKDMDCSLEEYIYILKQEQEKLQNKLDELFEENLIK